MGGADRAKEIADAHAYEYSTHDGLSGNIRTQATGERAVERASEGVRKKNDIGIYGAAVEGFACT